MSALDFSEQVIELSNELGIVSEKYATACNKYARCYYEFQKLLGTRLIKLQNNKPSIEKIIAEGLADYKDPNNIAFRDNFYGYEINKALKTGLEAQLEALKAKIMARQSVMRYNRESDTFGKG